ncbi:hypothetical protein FDUTEX481_09122 [Tolypothrix sp. PCC 7601]|nr:hypothetical protein FDUTEX481_09122 [Tolypothrix sp. PCC 7601]
MSAVLKSTFLRLQSLTKPIITPGKSMCYSCRLFGEARNIYCKVQQFSTIAKKLMVN